jgi:GNAT superfamily N-acetyltransferase
MKPVSIRAATIDDLRQVYGLVRELAIYEQEPNEPTVPFPVFERDFKTYYDCLVAEMDEKIIGIALYYWGYSTWKGKMLYLDDLVVKQEYRRRGIGSALFDRTVALAKDENAGQVRWQVLDWNEPAINLYRKAETQFLTNWWTCKLEKEAIGNYRDLSSI